MFQVVPADSNFRQSSVHSVWGTSTAPTTVGPSNHLAPLLYRETEDFIQISDKHTLISFWHLFRCDATSMQTACFKIYSCSFFYYMTTFHCGIVTLRQFSHRYRLCDSNSNSAYNHKTHQ